MKIKRFVVFAGDHYYPLGGPDDYQKSFDTIEEAKAFGEACIMMTSPLMYGSYDWYNVWDLETGESVESGDYRR